MSERRRSTNIVSREMRATILARERHAASTDIARLRVQLAERDEIIVALQHVIRELRHEIDNLRAEQRYLARGGAPLEQSRR
jgi:uncharacterized coiled-coil protein SlyX